MLTKRELLETKAITRGERRAAIVLPAVINIEPATYMKKTTRKAKKDMGGADNRKCSSERRRMEEIKGVSFALGQALSEVSTFSGILSDGLTFWKCCLKCRSHENGSVTEVDYVLKRLVHGMGSSRANSRNGFFSVLVALLSTVKSMKSSALDSFMRARPIYPELCMLSALRPEEAEIYTGQILVFGALIRSGQFVSKATVEEQHEVLSSLLIAGQQRSYLPIAAYTFLEELLLQNRILLPVRSVVQSPAESQSGSASADDDFTIVSCHKNNSANSNGSKDLPVQRSGGRKSLTGNKTAIDLQTINGDNFHKLIWPIMKAEVKKPLASHSLENLYFLLISKRLFPKVMSSKLLMKTVGVPEIIHKDSILVLSTLLLQISNSFHIHHPVYKEFAEQLATSPLLPDFWSQGVEPLLAKPNKNRDLLIIHIFQLVIANLTDKTQYYFTGTRTVQILSNKLKASGVKELATLYQNVVTCKMDKVTGLQGETELWHTAERKYAGELLTKLISNAPAVQDDHEWKLDMMKFFLELGMFHPINKDENNVVSHLLAGNACNLFFIWGRGEGGGVRDEQTERETERSLKNNFFRLFDQHPKLALPRLNNLCNTQSAIIHHLDSLLKNKKWVQRLRKPWSPEAKASLQKMIAVTKELELPKKGLPQSTVLIFRTMFMQMGIHLFINPDLAIEVLELIRVCVLQELHSCLNEIDTGNRKFDETNMEKEVQWVDVVVDLMLSLLSVNNHTLRIMINWVFPHLCPFLTPLALKQIIQESLDLDDMDPEEGQRINKELAQAFKKYKSATNNRKSKKMPRKDKALSHFRVRVLDLIEIYISSEPSLESCLDLIMPLFHLLEYCIPNIHQKPLESRVRTCISKLTGLKKFEVGKVTQEQLAELASELLSKGERTSVVFFDMNHKIAECVCFLVKASKHIPTPVTVPPIQWKMMKKIEVSPLTDVLRNALLDYFQNRGSLLQLELFQKLVQQMWDGNWIIVTLLAHFANDLKIRPFKQYQAIELLKIFFKENRSLQTVLSPDEEWKFSIPERVLLLKTIKLLKQNDSFKQKSLCKLLELLSQVHHCGKKINIELSKNWHVLGQALQMYKKNTQDIASSTKKSINKMLSLLGLKIVDQVFKGKPKDQVQDNNADQESVIESTSAQVQDNNADQKCVIVSTTGQVQHDTADQNSIIESATAHPQTNGIGELFGQQDNTVKIKRLKSKAKNNTLKKESTKLRTDAMSVGLQSIDFKGVDYSAVRDEYLSIRFPTLGANCIAEI
uniref:Uncharacterized protein n=1 Tax=Timema poppense TaxID=170557 RepID=A0A7R9CIY1_TIMPO|nr:unnamed protein product [Timema poppensis]